MTSDGQVHTSTSDNPLTNSAFIRLRNNGGTGGSQIDIMRNGGTSYSTATDPLKIDVLTLGSNLMDQWHQWTAAVIRGFLANVVIHSLYLIDGQTFSCRQAWRGLQALVTETLTDEVSESIASRCESLSCSGISEPNS